MTPATATPVTYGRDASIAQFSVAHYQRMVETGILTAADKVELLENYVVRKMPKNPLHDGTIDLVKAALDTCMPSGWLLRIQQAVVLSDSQPEPDFAIVRGNSRSFLARHPGPADVGLLIEVADSSLLRDQRDKARIYARANILCYWIANLVDTQVEVFAQPSGPTETPSYSSHTVHPKGDTIPLVFHGTGVGAVQAVDLLP